MNIFPIHTKADHQKALSRVSELMTLDPELGSPESDELEVLAQIIEIYEKKHHDLGSPTPSELIAFAMEQRGLSQKDLVPMLGSPSRVSEVLHGKRALTLPMIRNLHVKMGLPLDALVMGGTRPTSSTTRRPATSGSQKGSSRTTKRRAKIHAI